MPAVYTIVKKNSLAHKAILASEKHKNDSVVPVKGSHVLVPTRLFADVGNLVSHAKNRVKTRRLPNVRILHLNIRGVRKAIRLTNHDLRTYKKLTAPKAE